MPSLILVYEVHTMSTSFKLYIYHQDAMSDANRIREKKIPLKCIMLIEIGNLDEKKKHKKRDIDADADHTMKKKR